MKSQDIRKAYLNFFESKGIKMNKPKTVKTPSPPTVAINQSGIRLLVSAIKI